MRRPRIVERRASGHLPAFDPSSISLANEKKIEVQRKQVQMRVSGLSHQLRTYLWNRKVLKSMPNSKLVKHGRSCCFDCLKSIHRSSSIKQWIESSRLDFTKRALALRLLTTLLEASVCRTGCPS